jgi:hypothetical protein
MQFNFSGRQELQHIREANESRVHKQGQQQKDTPQRMRYAGRDMQQNLRP